MKLAEIDLVNKTWQETDEQVKSDYGNDCFEELKSNNTKLNLLEQKRIDQVAGAVTKALINKSPKNCYKCFRFTTKFYNLTPDFIRNRFPNSTSKSNAFTVNNL